MSKNQTASSTVADKLTLLLELIRQINSDLDLKSVLTNIIDAAKKITESEACSVFLADHSSNELILTLPSGPTADRLTGKRLPMNDGIAGWVASNRKPQIVNNVSEDDRFYGDFNPDEFITKNMLCVPLMNRENEVVGVLQAMNKNGGNPYDEDEIPVFSALANQAAIAINNARQNDEREALMGEIHHRVRNNMATISAFIQLQSLSTENRELKTILINNVTRILSMATVHDAMYNSKRFSHINFAESLEKVVSKTLQTLGKESDLSVTYSCDSVHLNVNQCIPCSLIVNEVLLNITNQHKQQENTIEIQFELSEAENNVFLNIKDSGNSIDGYTDDEDKFQFIEVVQQQMGATCRYEPGDQINQFSIQFEKSDRKGTANYNF